MRWYQRLFRRARTEKQLDAELRFHLDRQITDYVATGMTPEEAQRRARLEFGGLDQVKEECRDVGAARFIETLIQDIRYGLRQLRRNLGFTAVAIITLTLGIAATTAVFSVINGVLLKPLPYPNPSRVMILYGSTRRFAVSSVSYPNFLDWQRMNRSFTDLASCRWERFNLSVPSGAEVVSAVMVSAGFFKVLGVPPMLGRGFSGWDNHLGAAPTVILSYNFWQKHFGGTSSIIGKSITMGSRSYSIIGVLPENFWFFNQSHNDVFVPVGIYDRGWTRHRDWTPGLFVVGRLKPGIAPSQAQADMRAIAERLAQEYPKDDAGYGIKMSPVLAWSVGDARGTLWLLLGAVCFVLLIACVNVANLLLSRAAKRQREMAIRAALGAGARRVVRQLLTESVLLGLLGGALGVLLASAGTKLLLAYVPGDLPRSQTVSLDLRVLLFAVGVSVITGLIFGLAPALRSAMPDLQDALKEGSRGSTGEQHRLQRGLVIAEIGLALVLLIGAGLTLKSIWYLNSVNLGFNPNHALSFEVSLPPARYLDANSNRTFYKDLLAQLHALPGVKAAGATDLMPLSGNDHEWPFYVEGRQKPQMQDMPETMIFMTTPGYLRAMGISLLRGRSLTAQDNLSSRPVVLIDSDFARTFFPHQNPIGQHIIFPIPGFDAPREIVGVVHHVRPFGPTGLKGWKVQSDLYLPTAQLPDQLSKNAGVVLNLTLVVRTSVDPRAMTAAVIRTVQSIDNGVAVNAVHTVGEMESTALASQRFLMVLMSVFAGLALVLGTIGIYGVISYSVTQRTHEIGIRMALGAGRLDVLKHIVGQGFRLTLIGLGLGIGVALALTRFLGSQLYGVKPYDPLTLIAVSLILTGIALLACYIPARRAAKIDPMVALRHE
jgi:putative ABC transport system permease protein